MLQMRDCEVVEAVPEAVTWPTERHLAYLSVRVPKRGRAAKRGDL